MYKGKHHMHHTIATIASTATIIIEFIMSDILLLWVSSYFPHSLIPFTLDLFLPLFFNFVYDHVFEHFRTLQCNLFVMMCQDIVLSKGLPECIISQLNRLHCFMRDHCK